MAVKEVDFQEAVEFVDKHKTKLVWLGREPVEYISELLGLDSSRMIGASPAELVNVDRERAAGFKDYVFVCYHGNTSRHVASFMKDKMGVESLSLKGGVTAIVGEIF